MGGGRRRCAFSCIERLPTGPVQHETSFSPSGTTVNRSDCQSARHPHPLLELGRTASGRCRWSLQVRGQPLSAWCRRSSTRPGMRGPSFPTHSHRCHRLLSWPPRRTPPERASPQEAATNRVLLTAGIAAVVVYVIGDLLSALLYNGYSYLDQAISELSAFGSPVRPLPPFVHTHSHDPCSAAGLPHVARTPGRHPSRTWKRAFCWQPLQSGPRARREAAGGNEPVDATIVAGEQLGTLSTVRPSVSQHQLSE